MFFFFQAEDGIRDLVRSRGLGDVYKRQDPARVQVRRSGPEPAHLDLLPEQRLERPALEHREAVGTHAPVSYTHLTLPTIYSV